MITQTCSRCILQTSLFAYNTSSPLIFPLPWPNHSSHVLLLVHSPFSRRYPLISSAFFSLFGAQYEMGNPRVRCSSFHINLFRPRNSHGYAERSFIRAIPGLVGGALSRARALALTLDVSRFHSRAGGEKVNAKGVTSIPAGCVSICAARSSFTLYACDSSTVRMHMPPRAGQLFYAWIIGIGRYATCCLFSYGVYSKICEKPLELHRFDKLLKLRRIFSIGLLCCRIWIL